MDPLIKLLLLLVKKLLIFMMLAIVCTVSWQVFSRFILQSPSSYTEELARYLLIWIGLLGAAYAYHTKAHLGLDILFDKARGKTLLWLKTIIELSVMLFAITVLIYGGTSLVLITLELKQVSAALGIQMGLVYSVLPLSGLIIVLSALNNLINAYTQQGDN